MSCGAFSQTLSSLNGSNIFNIVASPGTVYTSAILNSTKGGRQRSGACHLAMMLLGFAGVGFAVGHRESAAPKLA